MRPEFAPKEVPAMLVESNDAIEATTIPAAGNASGADDVSGATVVVDDNREAGAPKVAEAIALLHEALRLLTELDVAGLDRQDRLDLSHELARGRIRMDAIRSGVLAEVAAKKDWEDGPTRTLVELEERVSQEPRRESQQNIARARGLAEDLPLFREAYLAGRVGSQYIDLVRSAIRSPKLKAQLADPVEGEAFLLEAAQSMTVESFRHAVRAWSIKFAPVTQERAEEKAVRQEKLHMFQKDDAWVINGTFTKLNGQKVYNALQGAMGRKAKDDNRHVPERRAATLVELCERAVQNGEIQPQARLIPHISAIVNLETLLAADARAELDCDLETQREFFGQDGDDPVLGKLKTVIPAGIAAQHFEGLEPGRLDDGTPLTPAQLQLMMCDSQISRVVFKSKSQVLDIGRKDQICTSAQARAIIARDRTCRFPGCNQTYATSQIHHVQYWEHGGLTNLDNLVMLCWHHHKKIHEEHIAIKRYEHGWQFVTRHGRVIADPNLRSDAEPPRDPAGLEGQDPPPDHGAHPDRQDSLFT